MKKALLSLSALALVATLATACTDSDTPRTSDRPGDRVPSASPATMPPSTSSTPPAPSSSTDSTTSSPSGTTGATGSSPSSSGTR